MRASRYIYIYRLTVNVDGRIKRLMAVQRDGDDYGYSYFD